MKDKRFLLMTLISLLTLGLMTFLDSCKVKDPSEGVKLIINYDLIKTFINIQFYDAASGEMIDQDIKVTITGPDAAAVVDNSGLSKDEFVSAEGFVSLGLNPNIEFVPSASSPVRFTIVASLDGYLLTSKNVTISEEGTFFEIMLMVNPYNPPNGITVENQTATDVLLQGVVQEEILVRTQNNEVQLKIPSGTVIKDIDGNPLNGSLDISIVHFNNLVEESFAAIPGGFETMVEQDGQTTDGLLFSAGCTEIVLTDQSGKQAKYFEQTTVELILEIENQTYNPETQTQVAVGDAIKLSSYDFENGKWDVEQSTTIQKGGSKGLWTTVQISHLSYQNTGWWDALEWCEKGVKIDWRVGPNVYNDCLLIRGKRYALPGNIFTGYFANWVCDSVWSVEYGVIVSYYQIYWSAKGYGVRLEWEDGIINPCEYTYILPGSAVVPDLCEQTTKVFSLSVANIETVTVTVDLTGRCASDPDVEIRPTFGVWYTPQGYNCWRWASMVDGIAEISGIILGQKYVVGTIFNGRWYEDTFTADEEEYHFWDIDFPEEVCNEIL